MNRCLVLIIDWPSTAVVWRHNGLVVRLAYMLTQGSVTSYCC